ncbi:MAG: bacillithiol biosynthesis deacetylase BshB1 [Armatimonadetes bacterium]|nr:bacillithiol biosynthesis deacetylase BshB1 [Armatimonadota bacterium]
MAVVLAIGPHPDDIEIAMGGTVCLLHAQGHEVVVCDLTDGEPTPIGSPERRAAETDEASRLLGVRRRLTLGLPNRFLQDTIEARIQVAEVIRRVRPDVLFVPYWVDAHPDHVAACALAEAARFTAKLTRTQMQGEPHYPDRVFHFFSTHYRLHVKPSFIVDISDHIETKMAAVAAYASQFGDERGNAGLLAAIRETSAYWGRLIHRRYGEAFVSREEIGIARWDGLI